MDENEEIIEYIAIRHDITEQVDQRTELAKNAQTDTLTKLGNRFKLLNDIHNEKKSSFFFLDIAKRTKNYIELTKTVVERSFETFKDMDAEFSVNLTLQDIMDEGLKEFIFHKLEEYKIGQRVVFEIVESEGIENFTEVVTFIEKLKSYGCKIAIDDFGTGYSNFEYLIQLKADYIKIDGSMIKNLDTDENTRVVVSTIVDFAKKMNIKTIAEFVKDETIYKIVKELDIDYSQGFYFGEPCVVPRKRED